MSDGVAICPFMSALARPSRTAPRQPGPGRPLRRERCPCRRGKVPAIRPSRGSRLPGPNTIGRTQPRPTAMWSASRTVGSSPPATATRAGSERRSARSYSSSNPGSGIAQAHPFQRGGRFSRKAEIPSRASSQTAFPTMMSTARSYAEASSSP